jgi:hypothetical protein
MIDKYKNAWIRNTLTIIMESRAIIAAAILTFKE